MQHFFTRNTADRYIWSLSRILCEYMLKKEIVTATVSRRNFCIKNKNKFSQSMFAIDWGDVFSASDTQTAFTVFYRKLIKIHALCFPQETISKRYNTRKPWLSPTLRDAIKNKNILYIKSIKYKCLHNETVYKNYHNCSKKITKRCRKEILQWSHLKI